MCEPGPAPTDLIFAAIPFATFVERNRMSRVSRQHKTCQVSASEFYAHARRHLVFFVQTPTIEHMRWAIESRRCALQAPIGRFCVLRRGLD